MGLGLNCARCLRIDFLGADGKSLDVEKSFLVFLGDVSELILGLREATTANLYKWIDFKRE